MEQSNQDKNQPLFWASALRIIATLFIFIFHSFGQSNISVYNLNIVGISIFCFLSGYFCYPVRGSAIKWFINRAQNILIPYWSVILIVIALNYYLSLQGKHHTAINNYSHGWSHVSKESTLCHFMVHFIYLNPIRWCNYIFKYRIKS